MRESLAKKREGKIASHFFFCVHLQHVVPTIALDLYQSCVCGVCACIWPMAEVITLCNTIIGFFPSRSCGGFFLSIFQLRACNYCFATRTRFVGREQRAVLTWPRPERSRADVAVIRCHGFYGDFARARMSENPFQFVLFSSILSPLPLLLISCKRVTNRIAFLNKLWLIVWFLENENSPLKFIPDADPLPLPAANRAAQSSLPLAQCNSNKFVAESPGCGAVGARTWLWWVKTR